MNFFHRNLCYIRSGDQLQAEKLAEDSKQNDFPEGIFYAAKGEMELAFQTIKKIEYWNYWEMLSVFHYYPNLLDTIREDKPFDQILKKVNSNWGFKDDREYEKHTIPGSKVG